MNYGSKCLPVKITVWCGFLAQRILTLPLLCIFGERKRRPKSSALKSQKKNMMLVFLESFKRSSYGLHWTAN